MDPPRLQSLRCPTAPHGQKRQQRSGSLVKVMQGPPALRFLFLPARKGVANENAQGRKKNQAGEVFCRVYFSNKAMKSDFKKLTPVSLSLKMSIRGTGII